MMSRTERMDRALESLFELLKLDYEAARGAADKWDAQVFGIKNWMVTSVGALLALSITADEPVVLLAALVVVLLFAVLDAMQHVALEDTVGHVENIEKIFHATFVDGEPLDTDYRFGVSTKVGRPTLRLTARTLVRNRHIQALYGGLGAAVGLACVTFSIIVH